MAISINRSNTRMMAILVFIFALVVVIALLAMPDRRTPIEKLGDAVHDLDKGPEKAARQLEDRSPGERLGDAIRDAGQ